MPTRVTPQQHAATDSSWTAPSRTSNTSRTDDSGSGAEGPARKRCQRGTAASDALSRRPSNSASLARTLPEQRATFTRRRSVREQKAPLTPRSPDFSPSKSDNLYQPFSSARSQRQPASTEPSHAESSGGAPSGYGYNPPSDGNTDNAENTSSSFDFLPSVSFDDLHSSITSSELKLSEFPVPGGRGAILAGRGHGTLPNDSADRKDADTGLGPAVARVGRTSSFLRRQSNAPRQTAQQVPGSPNMESQAGPILNTRNRRQSHFIQPSNPVMDRAPRKSIGPGVLDTALANQVMPQNRQNQGINANRSLSNEKPYAFMAPTRVASGPNARGSGHGRLLTTSREAKAKSLQPPPSQIFSAAPSMTPDYSRSSFIATGRSPGRSPGRRPGTPTSASKRLSAMPTHAHGLGARTVSPTDARRAKRMSMMQDPPPMPATPSTPSTPLPDAPSSSHSTIQSPALAPRKSVTPSSSRTTPDPNRKSYSSGLSNSSNTTNTSVRTSTGSAQQRLSQNISTSRLPTPKARNVHSSAGPEEGEDVPPVPAIPKAYESPKEATIPPFSLRKSSLPLDFGNNTDTTTTSEDLAPNSADATVPTTSDRGSRQSRGLTMGAASDIERTTAGTPGANRKRIQPLRLPPLNLLPLSTPTNARVAALHEQVPRLDVDTCTPAQKTTAKVLSTPMTASKAIFTSQAYPGDSTSAQRAERAESASLQIGSTTVPDVDTDEDLQSGRHTMTPYMSSSLPKLNGDSGYLQSKDSGEYNTINLGNESRTPRLMGPRAQASSRTLNEESSSRNASPTELDTPSSTSSIRQRLSMSFRRSSTSKPSQAAADAEAPPQSTKHDDMPPPKFPASATWTGQSIPSPSPSLKTGSHFHTRRRQNSVSSVTNGHTRVLSESWSARASARAPKEDPAPTSTPSESTPTPARTTSILSPVQKMLSSKNSSSTMRAKHHDPNLDPSDLSAEEEMRKLASKRKNFEAAAKDVDDLRRRATPKDRVSPAQALRVANLNIFERGEIIDYKDIYFCGLQSAKKHVGDLVAQPANFGYDDERGDYNIVNGDHLAYRYEIVDILGKGSFGQVVRCVDHKTGGLVAVKIIRNKKRFHQQALVEVGILQKLREWDPQNRHSMVSFTQSFYFRGHLCISTELLGMNLYEFIKSNNFQGFSLKLIRRFTKQLLSSLVLLKGHRVIHCDLKPENVLLAHPMHSEIKVIDFGSSCFENEKVYTYIQSRFYRSPEVILGMTYGLPIDMWSLGCILAELYTGYPIFPGENEQEQLACIMEVFGPPEKHLIERSTRKKLFFDSLGKPRLTVSSKGRRRRPSSKTLHQALKCDDEAFLDFITRCLRWDPERRLKPEEATQHEFITRIKKGGRSRPPQLTSATPVKRFNSITTTPSGSRPLPEPPATSFKIGSAARSRDVTTSSPSKAAGAANKRQSTVNGTTAANGVKRSSTGVNLSSNLPRVAPRSVSMKGEMATAAAAVATSARR